MCRRFETTVLCQVINDTVEMIVIMLIRYSLACTYPHAKSRFSVEGVFSVGFQETAEYGVPTLFAGIP